MRRATRIHTISSMSLPTSGVVFTTFTQRPSREKSSATPGRWLPAWLELEGFAYDPYSQTQFHHREVNLDAYRILILGPHSE
jgi:hypothetical protein